MTPTNDFDYRSHEDGNLRDAMTDRDQTWPTPPTLHNRYSPSVLLYLPYASGGASIRRIIGRLTVDQSVLRETDMEAWAGRGSAETYRLKATGHIYIFFDAQRMKNAVLDSGIGLADLYYLACLRDPRDMLVSLYHLTQDKTHLAIAEGSPIHAQMLIAAEKAAATPLDEYVLENVASLRSLLEGLRKVLDEIPAVRIRHLSYAALCHAFPQFLAGLVDVLNAQPSRRIISDLLRTEDVQRKSTLHKDSLAHFPKASPSPGRHKRDLKPETVERLYREFQLILGWMAQNDLPEFRELYT